MRRHHDLIVIGSGPGGAALAQRLAPLGLSILILERGGYLRRETANWSSREVFVDKRYQAEETWHDSRGRAFRPGLHRFVGGNSKVYGAALLRLRERDFEAVEHAEGVSPAWPLRYADFEPYYGEAERLFQVHGLRGEDPTEPPASTRFAYPPVAHEPQMQALHARLTAQGKKPFHLPLGILLDENQGSATTTSACIRCDRFDGFPCATNGKADAQVICVDPMLQRHTNVTLLTHALVQRLDTDASGRRVNAVQVLRNGVEETYSAETVVVACGALSSALLLLRSASGRHPAGLANGSGQVGRNYMRHQQSVLMALSRIRNDTVFQKTLALSDYYWGDADYRHPMGLVQLCAKTHADDIRGQLPGWLRSAPQWSLALMAKHATNFWLSSEDLPRAENRIRIAGDGRVVLELQDGLRAAHHQLRERLKALLRDTGGHLGFLHRDIPIAGTAHQCGTARFGLDPAQSVLDVDCKAHELDNLYVADASLFVSSGAVNPTLTLIANALRVADRIAATLGIKPRRP